MLNFSIQQNEKLLSQYDQLNKEIEEKNKFLQKGEGMCKSLSGNWLVSWLSGIDSEDCDDIPNLRLLNNGLTEETVYGGLKDMLKTLDTNQDVSNLTNCGKLLNDG